jgi:hypothetical protein
MGGAEVVKGGQIWVDEICFSRELSSNLPKLNADYLFADFILYELSAKVHEVLDSK